MAVSLCYWLIHSTIRWWRTFFVIQYHYHHSSYPHILWINFLIIPTKSFVNQSSKLFIFVYFTILIEWPTNFYTWILSKYVKYRSFPSFIQVHSTIRHTRHFDHSRAYTLDNEMYKIFEMLKNLKQRAHISSDNIYFFLYTENVYMKIVVIGWWFTVKSAIVQHQCSRLELSTNSGHTEKIERVLILFRHIVYKLNDLQLFSWL